MKRTLWLLLDDRRGSAAQARGIAYALKDKMEISEKILVYNKFGILPNWMQGRTVVGLDKQKSSPILPPFPDVVLSSSRRTVPTARFIRKLSGNKTKIVQLMYPSGGGTDDMDLIAVPNHDSVEKQSLPQALVITGAPTCIFDDQMQAAKKLWNPQFAGLPKPWTAVIIGGGIKGKPWPEAEAEKLANRLKQLHEQIGGTLLLTTSRRTGEKQQNILMEKLAGIPMYTYLWGEKKENPIMGFYACPDRIVVTADSVSMASEACGTGHPVLLYRGDWLSAKHKRFAAAMIANGYAADADDAEALEFVPKATLNPAVEIANRILEMV